MQILEAGEFIEAYESALDRCGSVDLRDFLPDREHPLYSVVLRELVRIDLEQSWTQGHPRPLQEYQQIFPELFTDHASLQEITFEEYRLRLQGGANASPREYQQQFGVKTAEWPTVARPQSPPGSQENELLAAFRDRKQSWRPESSCGFSLAGSVLAGSSIGDDLSDTAMAMLVTEATTPAPRPGSRFLGFQLLAELGRGAFGRVYLARQGDLANRLVALKISVNQFQESQTLAQLQHTNIVPLYSVHQAKSLQAVCMPYFGPATLGDVLEEMQNRAALPESGKFLVETLLERKRRLTAQMKAAVGAAEQLPSLENDPQTLGRFERLSYVEAILWLAARLADGLAHAHERGILHRDLKPANILLTDHGQPMLVDFNLSTDLKCHSNSSRALLGGTLPYMAPEHLEAFEGQPQLVDARSDLYSLGVVLFHLLTGQLPFPTAKGPIKEQLPIMAVDRRRERPEVRCWNRSVSPAVESIVLKLLEPEPKLRYQNAQELRDDLQRHQEHLPLRHAPNTSVKERMQKWVRRHPRIMSPTTLVSALSVIFVSLGALLIWSLYREEQDRVRKQKAETDLVKGDLSEARVEVDTLRQKARGALSQFRQSLVSLREQEGAFQAVQRLFDTGGLEREDSDEYVRRCRVLLHQYKVFDGPAWLEAETVRFLSESEQLQLRKDVGELLFLLARAVLFQIPPPRDRGLLFDGLRLSLSPNSPGLFPVDAFEAVIHGRIRSALQLNAQATACYPTDATPRALLLQRAVLARLGGDGAESERLFNRAAASAAGTAREDYLAAYEYAALSRFHEAMPLAESAVRREPHRSAGWFLLGVCHSQLANPVKALACYGVCIGLEPDLLSAYFNRGQLLLDREDWRGACDDFDVVLAKKPDFTEGYLERARARQGLQQHSRAVKDFTQALKRRPGSLSILFWRGKARKLAGDSDGAARDFAAVLEAEATDAQDWTFRGMARKAGERKQALAEYEQAVRVDPNYLPAMLRQAMLLDKLDRTREGVEVLDRAVAAHPDSAQARITRGVFRGSLGERQAALADAEAGLKIDSSPASCYQAGSVYAATSRTNPDDAGRALELLGTALRKGFGVDLIQRDHAWDALRQNPEFRRLALAVKVLYPAAPEVEPPQP